MNILTSYTPYLAQRYRKAAAEQMNKLTVQTSDNKKTIKTSKLTTRVIKLLKKFKNQDNTIKLVPEKQNQSLIKYLGFNFHIKEGETISVNDNLFINYDGKLTPLNISKELLNKLFPPQNQYSKQSKRIGNCWLISTINGLMQKPKGKKHIYNLFTQYNNNVLLEFEKNKVLFSTPTNIKVGEKGCAEGNKGVKLIEQGLAASRRSCFDYINMDNYNATIDVDDYMNSLNGGFQIEALKIISKDLNPKVITCKHNLLQKHAIKKYANNDDYFVGLTTMPNFENPRKFYGDKLMPAHSFSIKSYNKKEKTVSIIDPLKPEEEIKMDINELKTYPFALTYCKL